MLNLIKDGVMKQMYAATSAFSTLSESESESVKMLAFTGKTPITLPSNKKLVGFTKDSAIDSDGKQFPLLEVMETPAFMPLVQWLDEMNPIWINAHNAESYESRYHFHLNQTYEISAIEAIASDYGFFYSSTGNNERAGQAFISLSCPAENLTYSFVLTSIEDGSYYYQMVYTE